MIVTGHQVCGSPGSPREPQQGSLLVACHAVGDGGLGRGLQQHAPQAAVLDRPSLVSHVMPAHCGFSGA